MVKSDASFRQYAYRVGPPLTNDTLNGLFREAWPNYRDRDFGPVLARSLTYIGAFDGDNLIGFVYLAWDGGYHAFLLDTTVRPEYRRIGIGQELVRRAMQATRTLGVEWVHVDFEPRLREFYRRCGFGLTEGGLMNLTRSAK